MTNVITSAVLANGLRAEFTDTYSSIRNRMAQSWLSQVMDGITATNRQHEFAYFNSAPHLEHWPLGSTIPTENTDSVQFVATAQNWAKRIPWSKFDRKDDQTQSLMDMARQVGQSAALLPERFFFDLIQGSPVTLPGIPLAPDGAAMFATTVGGSNRFGVSGGNLLTGSGVATVSAILADYYAAIEQFLLFQDTKGQPLLMPELVKAGVVIVFGAANLQAFETAFLQMRQGIVYGSNTAAAAVSNIVQDASRNVELQASPRVANNDFFVFLKSPPKKPTFTLDREGVLEFEALEGSNNSDFVRTTGQEYVQWETRQGAGIALPYGAIRVDN